MAAGQLVRIGPRGRGPVAAGSPRCAHVRERRREIGQRRQDQIGRVVRRALEQGPQVVTRHGREAVVVVAASQFEALRGGRPDFKEFLRAAPDLGALRITRDRRPARKVTL